MIVAKIALWTVAALMLTGTIGGKDLIERKICAAVLVTSLVCATALELVPLFLG